MGLSSWNKIIQRPRELPKRDGATSPKTGVSPGPSTGGSCPCVSTLKAANDRSPEVCLRKGCPPRRSPQHSCGSLVNRNVSHQASMSPFTGLARFTTKDPILPCHSSDSPACLPPKVTSLTRPLFLEGTQQQRGFHPCLLALFPNTMLRAKGQGPQGKCPRSLGKTCI